MSEQSPNTPFETPEEHAERFARTLQSFVQAAVENAEAGTTFVPGDVVAARQSPVAVEARPAQQEVEPELSPVQEAVRKGVNIAAARQHAIEDDHALGA